MYSVEPDPLAETRTQRRSNNNNFKTFKTLLSRRDRVCTATADTCGLGAIHIIPLENSELIPREQLYSPENRLVLRFDLAEDYRRYEWIFDINGTVQVLYQYWRHRATVKTLTFGLDRPPSPEFVNLHNEMAKAHAKHHCPNCWKCVGETNIEYHLNDYCELFIDL